MTRGIPLAERLNRLWFDIRDSKSDWAPIVYVEPRPYSVGGRDTGTAGTQGSSRSQEARVQSKAIGKSAENRGAVPAQRSTASVAAQPATGSTAVIQRKTLNGASAASLPAAVSKADSEIVAGSSTAVEPSGRARALPTLLTGRATGLDNPVPVVGVRAPSAQQVRFPESGRATNLPLIRPVTVQAEELGSVSHPGEAETASAILDGNAASDAPLPRVRAPVVPLAPETVGLTLWIARWQNAGSRSVLPIVRDQSISGAARARTNYYQPLPFAKGSTAAHVPERPALTTGQALAVGVSGDARPRRTAQATAHRVGADEMPIPAETTMPPPPQVDIDGIVDKVERRFARRLAIESERRGRAR